MVLHAKYVWGKSAPDSYAHLRDREATCVGMPLSAKYAGLATLKTWIAESERYAGPEKCGVDMVVGNNPTVIDLEMAMPAWSGSNSALKIDMAALDLTGDKARLVLWEAKPLNAGALRAGAGDAAVIGQMNGYKAYLNAPGHQAALDAGYYNTCSALVDLAAMAGRAVELDDGIRKVVQAKRLDVVLEPRLVVFQGVRWLAGGTPELVGFSSGWAPHLDKIRRNQVKVADGMDPAKVRLAEAV